jgi:hypothetical protein
MRFNRNPDVNKRGAANRKTVRRRYRMPADVPGTSVPIEKMNMLQRIRYVSNYCFALAESERRKGNRADVMVVIELMQAGAMLAAKAAPFVHPKLAAIELEVSQPQPPPLDLRKLTDEELDFLESLMMKYKETTPDEGQDFVPPDEYQPSDEPPILAHPKPAGSDPAQADRARPQRDRGP